MSRSKDIRKQVEAIKRRKIVSEKVISLDEYRSLGKKSDIKTILVVDDDEVMRSAMKRILESEEYNVILAEDGLELSKIIDSTSLDLILLDVNLPWVDGYELCSLIKQNVMLQHVPLIMVSARKQKADIDRGFDAGCDEYVTKPFEVDNMTEVISNILKKSS